MKNLINIFSEKDIIPWKYIAVIFLFLFIVLLIPTTRAWFFYFKIGWLYIFLFAFLVSYLAVPIVRKIAFKLNIIDIPDARRVHNTPTPLLGGVAVYAAFAGTIIYTNSYSLELKGVAIGATIIFLTGLVDDIVTLRARLKLFIQIIAVSIMIFYGVVADFLPNTWWGHTFEIAITFLWMLGITNSLNFFDGMDGLATGLTIICSAFLCILAIKTMQPYLVVLSVALAGSCIGFFPYNFRYKKPAAIFLGDSGSTFMGFMLAGMVLMGGWGGEAPIKAYAMPILIMGIFIFDMVYTTTSRIASKKIVNIREWLEFTGKDHLHHRLSSLGLSAKQTVFLSIFLLHRWVLVHWY